MDELIVVFVYNKILSSSKRNEVLIQGRTLETLLNEKSQRRKTTYGMILFVLNNIEYTQI